MKNKKINNHKISRFRGDYEEEANEGFCRSRQKG